MRLWIRGLDQVPRHIEVTALPLIGQSQRLLGAAAIFWMSAAVPWMGMLIAIRSPAPRRAAFAACSSGIERFRPRSVVTWPWRRAVSLMWSM